MPILGSQASQNIKSFLGLAVDYLVVAGGGGGGNGAQSLDNGGGGGAGRPGHDRRVGLFLL
jgi:hypothetical protein